MNDIPNEIQEYFDNVMLLFGEKEYYKALDQYFKFILQLRLILKQNDITLQEDDFK